MNGFQILKARCVISEIRKMSSDRYMNLQRVKEAGYGPRGDVHELVTLGSTVAQPVLGPKMKNEKKETRKKTNEEGNTIIMAVFGWLRQPRLDSLSPFFKVKLFNIITVIINLCCPLDWVKKYLEHEQGTPLGVSVMEKGLP